MTSVARGARKIETAVGGRLVRVGEFVPSRHDSALSLSRGPREIAPGCLNAHVGSSQRQLPDVAHRR
jgi:hypothetical protein